MFRPLPVGSVTCASTSIDCGGDPCLNGPAVKFAARCELTIEPETYRRMMEHRDEIAKCAQARVLGDDVDIEIEACDE